jgi:glutathione S-transferase
MSDDLGASHGAMAAAFRWRISPSAARWVMFPSGLGDIRWREQYPNLAQLYEKLMQRPAFAETVPQG